MKIAIGIAYVFIAGLIVWVFMLSRTISKQGETILLLTPPTPPVPPVNPNGNGNGNADSNATGRQSSDTVIGSDLWNGLQKNVKDLKMEMTFSK